MSDEMPRSFTPAERPPLGEHPRHDRASGVRRGLAWLQETVAVIAIALALSLLVKTFLVQAFYIPSSSMEDTLAINDRILVNKLAPAVGDLQRGDVVVFTDPGGWLDDPVPQSDGLRQVVIDVLTFVGIIPHDAGEHLIKRVVGIPGDTVACCGSEGRLTVNGIPVDEPYLKPGVAPSSYEFEVVVPEGTVWLMGDNRSNSADSRAHMGDPGGGFVPLEHVVGRAVVTMWPLDRVGSLGGGQDAFAEVEGAAAHP
ncbi:MAG: signal peptidase I [Actinomycetes bacterium]|nr:signal peptidase I [Actinomycetes bacterium]MDX5381179.1 signal peptidase I [Actinomycetes bacterium]MDX5400463.1 signal peptidase I [Actinomycetes bacterium]MDX5450946.1 signal peptidase I [Actinomycetes bacterium]